MQPQKYFPCSPACMELPQGKGSGGRMDAPVEPHCAHGPNGSSIIGMSSHKRDAGEGGRGDRCSSREGTQQNPRAGADVRLMQLGRVGSSIKIFSG